MTTLVELFYGLLTRHHLIPEIILDEVFWETWKAMHKYNTLSETQLSKLQQEIEPMKPTTSREILQLKLLRFLIYLSEGEFCKITHNQETTETALESALVLYKDLMESFPSQSQESCELKLKIITQAVYVCCRNNNFELAQKVAERHLVHSTQNGSDISENVEEIQRSLVQWDIQEVLDSTDCNHSALITNNYSQFCKVMLLGLRSIVDSLYLQAATVDEGDFPLTADPNDMDLNFERNIMKTLLHMKIESWCPKDHVELWNALCEHGMSDSYDEKAVAIKVKNALERLNLLQEIKKIHKLKN